MLQKKLIELMKRPKHRGIFEVLFQIYEYLQTETNFSTTYFKIILKRVNKVMKKRTISHSVSTEPALETFVLLQLCIYTAMTYLECHYLITANHLIK